MHFPHVVYDEWFMTVPSSVRLDTTSCLHIIYCSTQPLSCLNGVQPIDPTY